MIHKTSNVIGVILAISAIGNAEIRDYPSYFFRGLQYTYQDETNRAILATSVIAVAALNSYDEEVRNYSQKKNLMSQEVSHYLDLYGQGWAYKIGFVGVGAWGYSQDGWNRAARDLKYYATAITVTGVTTEILKRVTRRERPNQADDESFPSGHTSASFALATVLDELYGHSVGVPAYVAAGLVGWQRIHDDKHWFTDVLAGAALGTIVGRGFGKVWRSESRKVSISASPDFAGFSPTQIVISWPLD